MQRLFLALWPDDAVRAAIDAAARGLGIVAGRPVPPRNLHATLVFLGATDAARRACVEHAAALVRIPAFTVELSRVEVRRRGGLIWLAPATTPPAAQALVTELNAALAGCGHTPEPRPFRLHVTLARDARVSSPGAGTVAPVRWQVGEFCLVSSRLTAQGSEYTVEARWPLG